VQAETTLPAETEDTTVAIPAGIAFATVRSIVAELQAAEPHNRERIGRAINVLLTSTIRETAELGVYQVQSCADSDRSYTATTWACDCPDRQRHADQRCKHSVALQVLSVASAHAAYERAQTRYLLTAKGAAALGEVS
jgi:hypothetical protein